MIHVLLFVYILVKQKSVISSTFKCGYVFWTKSLHHQILYSHFGLQNTFYLFAIGSIAFSINKVAYNHAENSYLFPSHSTLEKHLRLIPIAKFQHSFPLPNCLCLHFGFILFSKHIDLVHSIMKLIPSYSSALAHIHILLPYLLK